MSGNMPAQRTPVAQDNLLAEHSGGLIATAIGSVLLSLQWLLKREIKRRDDAVDDHEKRLRAVEGNHATRADITGLYEQINGLRNRAEERHIEILERLP